jgi:hypothetical protein
MIGATPIEATPLFNELLPSNNIVGSWFSPKAGRVIAADGSNRVHEGILDWHAYRLGKAGGGAKQLKMCSVMMASWPLARAKDSILMGRTRTRTVLKPLWLVLDLICGKCVSRPATGHWK